MTTPQDCSVGWSNEGAYKTYVAAGIHQEFLDEGLTWEKGIKQGMGLRVGSRVDRSTRRVYARGDGKGDLSLQLPSKGMGKLWTAALGTGTSTLVSGTTYQQLFTLGDTPNSLSVQKGVPRADGTVDAYSFLGCMVGEWELDSPNGEDVTVKYTFDIGDITTAQAYVAPLYPSGVNVFNFGQASLSIGGTLTVPTTTALASMSGAASVGIRSFNIKVSNPLDGDRYNYGSNGRKAKPTVQTRKITGKFTAEYDGISQRDAFLNDTDQALLFNLTGSAALSTGFETFQVALPCLRLEGDLPAANGGKLITVDHAFTVFDNTVAAQPLYVAQRTADNAL